MAPGWMMPDMLVMVAREIRHPVLLRVLDESRQCGAPWDSPCWLPWQDGTPLVFSQGTVYREPCTGENKHDTPPPYQRDIM